MLRDPVATAAAENQLLFHMVAASSGRTETTGRCDVSLPAVAASAANSDQGREYPMNSIKGAAAENTAMAPKFRAPRLVRSLMSAVLPALSLGVASVASSERAVAACVQSGSTVTCSGATNTGFGTGVENNLALTVLPDGSITVGNAQAAVNLGSGNTVVNNGAIAVGDNSLGIQGTTNNSFTNNGSMAVGSSSVAMFTLGNSVLTNTGTISSTAQGAVGLDALGAGNMIVNSGTINMAGAGSYGIGSSGATILNSGVITVGSAAGTNGAGIWLDVGNTLNNTGTVTAAGVNGMALSFVGDGNTVTNSGMIVATASGASGIAFTGGQNNTVVNNGAVLSGANGYSLASLGTTGNSITNNGTLDGLIMVFGTGNSLTNAGLITITDPGTALAASNLIFAGTFAQTAQGTLALRVDNAGLHDGLSAEGQASLNGTLRAVLQPGLYNNTTTYNNAFVTSGAINGQFANVTSSSAFFNAVATYNASSVDLTLTRIGFGSVSGETWNQRSIGNALEAGYSTALTGTAATFYSNLLQAGSLHALDLLSGEGTSGTQNTAFHASALFGQTMEDRMEAWRAGNRGGVAGAGALGYAAERPNAATSAFAALKAPVMAQPQWNAWAAGFGAEQRLAGDAGTGSADFRDRAAGGSVGVDRLVNPDLLVGVAAGGSSATFSVNDRTTSGRLEGAHVGAYAMQRFGAGYFSAQLAYSHFNNSTTRTVTGVGPTETAQGSFASDQLGGRLEIGHAFDLGHVSVTPFAAIQAARLWQSAYAETSTAGGAPGVLGLSYAAREVNSLPASLGVKFDGRLVLGNGMIWSPFVHGSWVHEFEPSRVITAALTGLPVPAFTIAGASAASDTGRLDLGSRLALNRWWEVSARFTGEFSNLGQSYSGMGAVRASW